MKKEVKEALYSLSCFLSVLFLALTMFLSSNLFLLAIFLPLTFGSVFVVIGLVCLVSPEKDNHTKHFSNKEDKGTRYW